MSRTVISAAILVVLSALGGCIHCYTSGHPTSEAIMHPADAPGVSITLAKDRKHRLSDVAYKLSFDIDPWAETYTGVADISFSMTVVGPEDLLLDFAGKSVEMLTVNGQRLEPQLVANHIKLPKTMLAEGANTVSVGFTSGIGAAGEGLIMVEDKDDGMRYLYTLNVPADGHTVFPCFDQPDLKATYELHVKLPAVPTYEVPMDVISNTQWSKIRTPGDKGPHDEYWFPKTKPLSTYVFAFAIGFFRGTERTVAGRKMTFYTRQSQRELADQHADEIFRLHAESWNFLENWFGVPYPFEQFSFVCVPDFPFGGMEHAGCIFYGEDPMLFRGAVSKLQEARRADLIAHETAHMWFGDLVTMPWFNDVWLKEGYATFMAHKALEKIIPDVDHNAAFFLRNYPSALETDATAGSTPMRQPLMNMADAKSNYGPIIYKKGPAVLRALEYMIGEEAFQKGSKLFLERHAYDCGSWEDLRYALEDAWGKGRDSLLEFGKAWIEGAGVPEVGCVMQKTGKGGAILHVKQKPTSGDEQTTWPLALEVSWLDTDEKVVSKKLNLSDTSAEVEIYTFDDFSFANFNNRAYARFVLDAKSRRHVMANMQKFKSLLLRSMLWEALWSDVENGNLAPRHYIEFVKDNLFAERDQRLLSLVLGRSATALRRFMKGDERDEMSAQLETALIAAVEGKTFDEGTRLLLLRRLLGMARSKNGLGVLAGLAGGEYDGGGLEISNRDRWAATTRLMLMGDSRADSLLEMMSSIEKGDEARRRIFMVECARGDLESKKRIFERFFNDKEVPERWVQDGASIFFATEQAELTDRFLAESLEKLSWIKRNRKIFFLAAWLDACVKSRITRNALEDVASYLAGDVEDDVRKKVLVPYHHLQRTLAVRSGQ